MFLSFTAVIIGLGILVWSADFFIEGAANLARGLGMSPLLIGIIIIGFGTSAPELVVSALSSLNNAPAVALGNAYGSNITNIALILGVTALIKPITVNSSILKKELPILLGITLFAAYQISDNDLSRLDAWGLLAVFTVYMGFTIFEASRKKQPSDQTDKFVTETVAETQAVPPLSTVRALTYMILGLAALMASSQILVWGAINIAKYFGVSDLIIGLTIVAIGTSLPELATSIVAARKGQTDLAVGNIIGSNLFNTLAVVGIAGAIKPTLLAPEVFSRDMMTIIGLTVALFVLGYGFKKVGKISRFDGLLLFAAYIAYNAWLVKDII